METQTLSLSTTKQKNTKMILKYLNFQEEKIHFHSGVKGLKINHN